MKSTNQVVINSQKQAVNMFHLQLHRLLQFFVSLLSHDFLVLFDNVEYVTPFCFNHETTWSPTAQVL